MAQILPSVDSPPRGRPRILDVLGVVAFVLTLGCSAPPPLPSYGEDVRLTSAPGPELDPSLSADGEMVHAEALPAVVDRAGDERRGRAVGRRVVIEVAAKDIEATEGERKSPARVITVSRSAASRRSRAATRARPPALPPSTGAMA